ncbi:hypothetical protein E2562_012119 [Oryza meyeriana var. granulata]|uniref:Uncharacterized protein n=1 Tax=Oryza meyeriana var. granulata TaxID=110450 RepID=A0A6G1F7F3_9ORYZ|nr:hypothetical protein E2562_012119 [Oryza meyeriana var. granulata]
MPGSNSLQRADAARHTIGNHLEPKVMCEFMCFHQSWEAIDVENCIVKLRAHGRGWICKKKAFKTRKLVYDVLLMNLKYRQKHLLKLNMEQEISSTSEAT